MSEFNFDPYRRYGGGMAPMAPQSRYVLPSYIERTAYGVKEMNPYNKLFEERIIFVGVQIDDTSANDIIAQAFDISFNTITWFTRIGVFVLPPLAFLATRRFCLGLQRRDRELLLHGRESGQILRLPHGEYIEIHTPISESDKAKILGKVDQPVLEAPPAADSNGVATPGIKGKKRRARFSRLWFDDNVARPTEAELEEAAHHGHEEHDHEVAELAAAGKDVPASLGPDGH